MGQSRGVGDWFATMFSQPLEVHAFVLGAFVGGILATVSTSGRPRTALVATLGVLLFTFGAFETVLCRGTFAACRHVRFKPWYFLAGVFLAQSVGLGVLRRAVAERPDLRTERGATTLAGAIVAVLLVLATTSLAAGRPAHPVTGLATVGGFAGSVLGFSAYQWSRPGGGTGGYVAAVRRVVGRDVEASALFVAAGTVFGFGYPRLFWEVGRAFGPGGFPLGPVTWVRSGVASVALYVLPALAATVAAAWLRDRRDERLDGGLVAAVVFGYATYAACLALATGLAATVWFRVVPVW
ncbi:hypothetical protein HZS55_11845 [Halosimplex rubrum]|uniref:Uncharacterized protein n=1 Tax=Halosimplex rubrum TaxID=869889 RepID=A0A7D5SQS2_9EURY|nr:hypothetical protein [Halosimplex rubrum]QLH77947.1 hypothetical protein HZS55_11845 [Halosimplex rubrum]